MAVTKFGRETTTHNGQNLASGVLGWSLAQSALISRRFATKRYTQDEDDGEDAFAGCIWRGVTTSSRTQTVFHEDVQSVRVVYTYCHTLRKC